MKRIITGLVVVATALTSTVMIAGSAHADPVRPPGVPASYVLYKIVPGSPGDCYEFGRDLVQQGLIKNAICTPPPILDIAGYNELWALLP